MLQHLLVIIGMALADTLYTLWARKASQAKALQAAIWASLIIPTYGFVVIMYNQDPQYLVSAMIGAFLGTYITVKLDSRTKTNETSTSSAHSNVFDNFEGREIIYSAPLGAKTRSN